MWHDSIEQVFTVLLSGLFAYLAIVTLLHVSGKRSLSKLNAFDFIVTIALGSILASTLLSPTTSVTEGIAGMLALLVLQFAVTFISARWHGFAKLVRSEPKLVLCDGKFLDHALKRERVTRDEILAAIRKKGHGRVEDIAAVVMESDGSFSVMQEGPCEDLTALSSVNPPGGET